MAAAMSLSPDGAVLVSQKSGLRQKVRAAIDFGVQVTTPAKSQKSDAEKRLIRDKLQHTTVLGALAPTTLDSMIDFMSVNWVSEGQTVALTHGLYVILEGALDLLPDEKLGARGGRYEAGSLLGELQLMHERQGASLTGRAAAKTKLCHLQRDVFHRNMSDERNAKLQQNMRLLSSIEDFRNLSVAERSKLADACNHERYDAGDTIIVEGMPGSQLFILASGCAKVYRDAEGEGREKMHIDTKYPGDYFGEAALLSEKPRNATVYAAEHGTECLCINKSTFDALLGPLTAIMERKQQTKNELMMVEVEIFRQLTADCRAKLLERMSSEEFADGDFVFKKGEMGDRMFIIKSGEVEVLVDQPTGELQKIDHLYHGKCFGERALINEEPRMAHCRAKGKLECFAISKADFEDLACGKRISDYWRARWEKEETRDPSQLLVVKSLGSGAFGTAWLVQHRKHPERMYALKMLDKASLKQRVWSEVVLREKSILASLPINPFVVTLYNAYQCPKSLYMLMELAPGGELYQILAKNERFHPIHARFFIACIVLAIEHLHKHAVVFRDMKPENLLLSREGHLKLIDMGFARRLRADEKAHTLCGTPYYLAPEMIQHLGHDMALDWWSVGVLAFEMIEGAPPFLGNNEMEVYDKVLRLDYTYQSEGAPNGTYFTPDAKDLIQRMICLEPRNRLGNLRNGADDIKSHRWFSNPTRVGDRYSLRDVQPFDWFALAEGPNSQTGIMQAPFVPDSKLTTLEGPPARSRPLVSLNAIQTSPEDKDNDPNWLNGWSSFVL